MTGQSIMPERFNSTSTPVSGTPATSMEDLAERAETLAAAHLRTPSLDVVRGFFNELGVLRIRHALHDAPDLLANALETQRATAEAERVAKETYDNAALEGEWLLSDSFVVDKNRTYLVVPCSEGPHRSDDASLGTCTECNGTGTLRRAMTVDEKKAYLASAMAKMPEVAKAADALREAQRAHERARDETDLARTRLQALRHEYDGLMVELQSLCLAIQAREMTK